MVTLIKTEYIQHCSTELCSNNMEASRIRNTYDLNFVLHICIICLPPVIKLYFRRKIFERQTDISVVIYFIDGYVGQCQRHVTGPFLFLNIIISELCQLVGCQQYWRLSSNLDVESFTS